MNDSTPYWKRAGSYDEDISNAINPRENPTNPTASVNMQSVSAPNLPFTSPVDDSSIPGIQPTINVTMFGLLAVLGLYFLGQSR
jgi:hypothetical protein